MGKNKIKKEAKQKNILPENDANTRQPTNTTEETQPEPKEKTAPSTDQLHKQVIHLRVVVAILALGLILLGIKSFWPDKEAEATGNQSVPSSEASGNSEDYPDKDSHSSDESKESEESSVAGVCYPRKRDTHTRIQLCRFFLPSR